VRYFTFVSLFLAAMMGLVLAGNFIILYICWEGVGLCSYLLIGHYFQRPSAAAAARKAFLVTRIGDAALMLGILLLWRRYGYHFDFASLFTAATADPDGPTLTLAGVLLFLGAAGKSAQFPLHVWLADAMEGPTPVSALIHAATMVTAGVYLVARCTPLFLLAPAAQFTVAAVGCFTALLAALIALTQTDLKRVLAYSTISQLGYMFLALGCGLRAEDLPRFAVTAALFHLFTHAFFKALLFLAAGSVMHAMGDVIDMRRFGGLRKVLPITHVTFLCGAAALAGFPLLSGFFSKDMILETVLRAGHLSTAYAAAYYVLFAVALATAGLTAFYTFRAYFLTFHGPTVIPPEAGDHAHESPPIMTVPLIVLAVGSVIAGIAAEPPGGNFFSHYVSLSPLFQRMGEPEHHFDWLLAGGSALVALAGIGVAWLVYGREPGMADRIRQAVGGLYDWSVNRFYIDELYEAAVVRPLSGLATVSKYFDRFLDDLTILVSRIPWGVRLLVRPVQNGLVQFYAVAMVLGLTVFLGFLAFRSGR